MDWLTTLELHWLPGNAHLSEMQGVKRISTDVLRWQQHTKKHLLFYWNVQECRFWFCMLADGKLWGLQMKAWTRAGHVAPEQTCCGRWFQRSFYSSWCRHCTYTITVTIFDKPRVSNVSIDFNHQSKVSNRFKSLLLDTLRLCVLLTHQLPSKSLLGSGPAQCADVWRRFRLVAGTYLSVAGTQCWLPWLHMALDKIFGAMSRKIGIDSAAQCNVPSHSNVHMIISSSEDIAYCH